MQNWKASVAFVCYCLDSHRSWQQNPLFDEITYRDPCPARLNPSLSDDCFPPAGWIHLGSHWTSMNKSWLLSHTPEMFCTWTDLWKPCPCALHHCPPALTHSSPPEYGWALLPCTHTRSPLWHGDEKEVIISPTTAHPPQVPEAMKALRNLLLVGTHPQWHIQSFSSSPEPKASFTFGLPP